MHELTHAFGLSHDFRNDGNFHGNLMGNLFRSTWYVQGLLARTLYVSLHLLHHQAVLGTLRTGVLAVARFLVKRATPLVKLH